MLGGLHAVVLVPGRRELKYVLLEDDSDEGLAARLVSAGAAAARQPVGHRPPHIGQVRAAARCGGGGGHCY